jgi:diacylglycerol kinase family enzyme
MSKHRPAATFDELDDAEVQIRLDEETYRRLQRAFLDAVDHGYSEDFETFVYNNTATTSRIVVTDEDGGEEYR